MNQKKKSSLKLFIYLSVLLHLGAGAVYYFNRSDGFFSDKNKEDAALESASGPEGADGSALAEESAPGAELQDLASGEKQSAFPPGSEIPLLKSDAGVKQTRAKKTKAQKKPPLKASDNKSAKSPASVPKKKRKALIKKKKPLSAGKKAGGDKTAAASPIKPGGAGESSAAISGSSMSSSAAPQEDFIIGEFNLPNNPEETLDSLEPQSSLAEGGNSEQTAEGALPDFSNESAALPAGAGTTKPDPTELDSIKLDPAEANGLPQSVSLSETEEIANLSLLNNQNELPGFSSLQEASELQTQPGGETAAAQAPLPQAATQNQAALPAEKATTGGSPAPSAKKDAEGLSDPSETPAGESAGGASSLDEALSVEKKAESATGAAVAARAAGDGPFESNEEKIEAEAGPAAVSASPAALSATTETPPLSEEISGEDENEATEAPFNAPSNEPFNESGEDAAPAASNEEEAAESQPAFKTPKEPSPANAAASSLEKADVSFKNFSDLKQRSGNPSLIYPKQARQAKAQGSLDFIFYVTDQGLVEKIQLKSSSGHRDLDNSVLRTFARYKFQPGQSGWVRHTVEFHLKGEETELLKLREK